MRQTPDRALIERLGMQEARPMPDRVDRRNQAFRRGRWSEVTDLSRIDEHGQPWCVNVAGHCDHNGAYPDARRHAQRPECHSREAFLDRARRDLDGEDVGFCMYTRRRVSFRSTTPRRRTGLGTAGARDAVNRR